MIYRRFHFIQIALGLSKCVCPPFPNELGVKWKQAVFYNTVISDLSDLADVYYDILVFFSPSGIDSLFHNFPDFKQNNTNVKSTFVKLILAGVLLFSGSIFLLATKEFHGWPVKYLGPITPIGGLLLISAWGYLMLSFLKK